MERTRHNSFQENETSPFPTRLWTLAPLLACLATRASADSSAEYPDFYSGKNTGNDKGIEWVQAITVSSPSYRSEIKGDVTVNFSAPGMTKVKAMCWQQPLISELPLGNDEIVAADIGLDATGKGSFVFHANRFPNGPITLRIYAKDNAKKQDICELQLFNQGGVIWNQGIPKTDPVGAQGMKLVYSDDFDGPLSISNNGNGAKYSAHKTGGGDFSGWQFANVDGDMNPFSQVGTFLRIHASKRADGKASSGLLSSAHDDGTGFYASAPCYFECRFLAQSVPGAWPAFWLLSKNCLSKDPAEKAPGTDELDIIEAYGGYGNGNPNFPGYAVTTHYWSEKDAEGNKLKDDHADIPMMDLGGKSTWSTTFHTYGVKITQKETTYYFDDLPAFTYPTKGLSKTQPFWFLINYAMGGISGWHIDAARYGNASDMWVDYVRVYQGQ